MPGSVPEGSTADDGGRRRSLARALAGALGADWISRRLDRRIDALVRARMDEALEREIPAVVKHTLLSEYLVYGDPDRLSIDETAIVNNSLFNVASGNITIGPWACLAHSVSLITGVHDFTRLNEERQLIVPPEGRDIVVEEGAWLSSHVVVLGPARIGAHAVVAAGSVVRSDVAPLTMVAGVPARFVRRIEPA